MSPFNLLTGTLFMFTGCVIFGCNRESENGAVVAVPFQECAAADAETLLVVTLDLHQFGTEKWMIPLRRSHDLGEAYSPPGLAMGHGHGVTEQGTWFSTGSRVYFKSADTTTVTLDVSCRVTIGDADVFSFADHVQIPVNSPATVQLNDHADLKSHFASPGATRNNNPMQPSGEVEGFEVDDQPSPPADR